MDDNALYAPQPPIATGLRNRCPRCGQGRLFQGFLRLAPRCSSCGLDYSFADAGDGPAVFVIMIVGFIVAGAALVTEIAYSPPIWVHFVLWGPLVLILCVGMLRPLKGVLVALQYITRRSRAVSIRSPDACVLAPIAALPGVLTFAAFAVLVSLGNWQVRRLAWKEDLIERVEERMRRRRSM